MSVFDTEDADENENTPFLRPGQTDDSKPRCIVLRCIGRRVYGWLCCIGRCFGWICRPLYGSLCCIWRCFCWICRWPLSGCMWIWRKAKDICEWFCRICPWPRLAFLWIWRKAKDLCEWFCGICPWPCLAFVWIWRKAKDLCEGKVPEGNSNGSDGSNVNAKETDLVYDHNPDHPIQLESMVMFEHHSACVVKLIFRDTTSRMPDSYLVALEVEPAHPSCTAGIYRGLKLVNTARRNILFCPLDRCEADLQFIETTNHHITEENIPLEHRTVTEPQCPSHNLESACGLWKGIQGDINSCYMDSTLFSMFAFSDRFDSLLEHEPDAEGLVKVLREGVVYPLRKYGHVASDTMHEMRDLLDGLGKVRGITDREKDPEEFINLLLNDMFKCAPLIELSTNQTCNTLSLVGDKDETTPVPTVQMLLKTFMSKEKLKFKKAPKCLILQMPRFGKHYKIYDRIFPDLSIDLTDYTALASDGHRMCHVCGLNAATVECPACCDEQCTTDAIAFCESCDQVKHKPADRREHTRTVIAADDQHNQRDCKLDLSAVLCIETSHYVSFCRTAPGDEAPWVLFDSMSQREGGVNVPEVAEVSDAPRWLSMWGYEQLCQGNQPPRLLRRLFKDIYICIYCATGQDSEDMMC